MSAAVQRVTHPVFTDERGSLVAFDADDGWLPFVPARTFVIFDIPGGAARAGHAVSCHLSLCAVAGSLEVVEHRSREKRVVHHLDRPDQCLVIEPRVYISLEAFAPGSVLTVIASASLADTTYYSLDDIVG